MHTIWVPSTAMVVLLASEVSCERQEWAQTWTKRWVWSRGMRPASRRKVTGKAARPPAGPELLEDEFASRGPRDTFQSFEEEDDDDDVEDEEEEEDV